MSSTIIGINPTSEAVFRQLTELWIKETSKATAAEAIDQTIENTVREVIQQAFHGDLEHVS